MNSIASNQANPCRKAVALLTSFFHNSIPNSTHFPRSPGSRICNAVSLDCIYRGMPVRTDGLWGDLLPFEKLVAI